MRILFCCTTRNGLPEEAKTPPLRGSRRGARGLPLLDDLVDDSGADGASALADREPQPLLHGDRLDELHLQLGVVARHDHLHALAELDDAGDVGGPEVELPTVARADRRMP